MLAVYRPRPYDRFCGLSTPGNDSVPVQVEGGFHPHATLPQGHADKDSSQLSASPWLGEPASLAARSLVRPTHTAMRSTMLARALLGAIAKDRMIRYSARIVRDRGSHRRLHAEGLLNACEVLIHQVR
jgi:hypothetical protein